MNVGIHGASFKGLSVETNVFFFSSDTKKGLKNRIDKKKKKKKRPKERRTSARVPSYFFDIVKQF